MDDVLQQAITAIRAGDKQTGEGLLAQIIKANPRNELAWMWLGEAVDEVDRKLRCYHRVLAINPHNSQAQQWITHVTEIPLDETPAMAPHRGSRQSPECAAPGDHDRGNHTRGVAVPTKRTSSSTKWLLWLFVVILVTGTSVLLLYGGSENQPSPSDYQPNPDDAFQAATTYAARLLIDNHDVDTITPSGCKDYEPEWRKEQVDELGQGKYAVRGAVKSINYYCIYDASHFSATVAYSGDNKSWSPQGDVVFSNPCVTTESRSTFDRRDDECIWTKITRKPGVSGWDVED